MNGLRQLWDATGGHQVGWKSPTVDDNETASQQHGEESQTGIEVQSSVYKDRQYCCYLDADGAAAAAAVWLVVMQLWLVMYAYSLVINVLL